MITSARRVSPDKPEVRIAFSLDNSGNYHYFELKYMSKVDEIKFLLRAKTLLFVLISPPLFAHT